MVTYDIHLEKVQGIRIIVSMNPTESHLRSKLIQLTQGQTAVVDEADFELLSRWNWCALWAPSIKSFYAVRRTRDANGKWILLYMHREIFGLKSRSDEVDHTNHNTLDNRRKNLVVTDRRGNAENMSNQSQYGVGVTQVGNRFKARVRIDGKLIHLGYYSTPGLAQRARKSYIRVHIPQR